MVKIRLETMQCYNIDISIPEGSKLEKELSPCDTDRDGIVEVGTPEGNACKFPKPTNWDPELGYFNSIENHDEEISFGALTYILKNNDINDGQIAGLREILIVYARLHRLVEKTSFVKAEGYPSVHLEKTYISKRLFGHLYDFGGRFQFNKELGSIRNTLLDIIDKLSGIKFTRTAEAMNIEMNKIPKLFQPILKELLDDYNECTTLFTGVKHLYDKNDLRVMLSNDFAITPINIYIID